MLQGDVGGQDAASAQERTTVPDVPLVPRGIATGITVMTERHTYHDEIRSRGPEREYAEEHEPEPEVGPQVVVQSEQRGMETPHTGIPTEYPTHLNILEGVDRRSTINGMMAVLGTQPELENALKDIAASPISATVDVVNAVMRLCSAPLSPFATRQGWAPLLVMALPLAIIF
jgi:hypothetical protein